MATATTTAGVSPAKVPVEVYLAGRYEPDADYVDGEVRERPMGENDHSKWQLAICKWFIQHEMEWNLFIRPELRIQVLKTNYLVADVAILDASLPEERVATLPPLAVFEVWSPESSVRRLMRKLALYEEMGVPQIWHVDPADGIWQKFVDGRLVDHDALDIPDRGIQFGMEEIAKLVR